ncbi:hypothetical protein BDP27DRAFT_1315333 [Rhodocollybia butyracea]|uniref:Histone deacetylase interacting domain-containing protein n=1 Tax=Rhodocollybia butyracea TaxID=206335 RepID=A0A9P5Q6V4_9AGAR|nr:hypothetical protein BDP27DRAFT_1315333 [Rhodocollybia butyracea]
MDEAEVVNHLEISSKPDQNPTSASHAPDVNVPSLPNQSEDAVQKPSFPTVEPIKPPHDIEMAEERPSVETTKGDEELTDNVLQERPLNVTDALSYLDAVKNKFSTQPDVYNHFLDIMKEFKSQQIDTPGVIKRGHPLLIQGFNTFLPVGYRIECSVDANHITVTTPRGTKMETTNTGRGKPFQWSDEPQSPPVPSVAPKHPDQRDRLNPMRPSSRRGTPDAVMLQAPQAMEPAVAYVQKIKQRCDPETYRQFLDILSRFHHSPESINEDEVSKQISHLFKDAPDLRSDFRIFMPEGSQSLLDDNAAAEEGRHHHRDRDHHHHSRRKVDSGESSLLPQKRKRKPGERDGSISTRDREKREIIPVKSKSKRAKIDSGRSIAASASSAIPAGSSSARLHPSAPSLVSIPHPAVPPQFDPSLFFDRVKRALDSRETYNEFLKVVNLFTQGYIDTARLVKESRNFLVGDGELMRSWKEILGWDGKKEEAESWSEADGWTRPVVVDGVIERPVTVPGKADLSAQYGSYRRLPESEINVTCSGRDSMCRDVLNDEWVSHPTWALNSSSYSSTSNSSGNVAYPDPFDDPTFFWSVSRKNVYEEALHRSEEERHEYDFHIEAISRTIAILEPINNRITQLSPEERGTFRIKPNLGGSAKAIHQRVVRKIYGREIGTEVLACMQDSPAHAIPVVIGRLKQKEEEWKRAQREWNKVWREVDARNYAKSLDHQSVNFKAADKKALTTKAFVSEIEAAREEQMTSRASLLDPLFVRTRPRHQLEIGFDDLNVLQDSLKLVFSFLDRTQGQIPWTERRRIEAFLRGWVPLVFMIDAGTFNAAFTAVQEMNGADGEMDVEGLGLLDVDTPVASSSRAGGSRMKKGGGAGSAVSGGDLRKKLLKSEQAKSGRKTRTGAAQPSPSVSRFASPAPTTERNAKILPTTTRKRGIFFTNTTFYVLLRLIGVLYSRLHLFKSLGSQLAQEYLSDSELSPSRPTLPYTFSDSSSIVSHVRAGADSSSFERPITEESAKLQAMKDIERERKADAAHFYDILLQSCERLFDNEIEQAAFEDQMRGMFGIKVSLTASFIDIPDQLAVTSPTTQEQINNRRNVEKVLGPDENMFRIDWLTEEKLLTVQLIGKDDSSYDDSEVLTGRWQSYIDSYVTDEVTTSVTPQKVDKPFLGRNLRRSKSLPNWDIIGSDALEIKVCVRTYRLFYVSDTEDYMCSVRRKEDYVSILPALKRSQQARKSWIERNQREVPEMEQSMDSSVTRSAPESMHAVKMPELRDRDTEKENSTSTVQVVE